MSVDGGLLCCLLDKSSLRLMKNLMEKILSYPEIRFFKKLIHGGNFSHLII